MARVAHRTAGWLFGVLVAASLGFGATQALATTASACYDNGSTMMGACSTSLQCTDRCRVVWGPEGDGQCRSGCCFCR